MGIQLFKHNAEAYSRAVRLLENTGRAAVIHPTGTGKTYIAFKLCEDNAGSRILWLSPSEYIFKTQLENARRDGFSAKNITFLTYSALLNRTDEDIVALAPDFIVLDEFHRAGAEEWGRRVKYLLDYYAGIPVLGLSATNVRYLDNSRDMAEELFEGNVVSQMTLGEAIVRGILPSPKYITALYEYGEQLKKYERKVSHIKSAPAREEAERYLQALRRALQNAEGLDKIFARHIKGDGKYIIFCSDFEAVKKLRGLAPEMFGRAAKDIRIYTVYSEDPSSDSAFKQFKADNSRALKLLYSIDMLNEGVHVPDIDGVILFRPTVSPIIYKQQIGRALTAGGDSPVIFDIVNNFENLYSTGTVQDEMSLAAGYYRLTGRGDLIVNDRFELIDEVKDCRRLFEELEDSLTVSWETMYAFARQYYAANGNLEVPKKYKTPQGYGLGNWISVQRKVRAGYIYGNLTAERIAMLDSIGMVWENVRDLKFERNYALAKAYFEEHGNLNVPADYKMQSGFALGKWLVYLNSHRESLAEERVQKLNDIGMVWNKNLSRWYENYGRAKKYFEEHGDLNVPYDYKSEDGVSLYRWLNGQRNNRRALSDEQIKLLEDMGFDWTTRADSAWERNFERLAEYKRRNGNVNVPVNYVQGGVRLGKWLARQRSESGKLTDGQRSRLTQLGVELERADPWEVRYELACRYYEENGNLRVPVTYKPMGICLNKWLNEQKQIYLGKRPGKSLSQENIQKLRAIGVKLNK